MKQLKVAIFRFSSIGDILLTTPVVRCIHEQLDAEIHYFTKSSFSTLLDQNPHIHKIHSFKNLKHARKDFKKESFDLVIDLHKNLRSRLISFGFLKKTLRFKKENFKKWLLVKTKLNLLPKVSLVDRYFHRLEKINVLYDGQGLDVFFEKKIPVKLPESFVALSLAGTYYTKKIPFQKWKLIIKNIDKPMVLLGGKNESKMARELIKEFPQKKIINTVGINSLTESCFCIDKASLLITGDTGMMHIAAATDTPIFSIWGNTVPSFGFQPFFKDRSLAKHKSKIFENKELSCRPCSKLGYNKCPKEHLNCMNKIDFSHIAKLTNAI